MSQATITEAPVRLLASGPRDWRPYFILDEASQRAQPEVVEAIQRLLATTVPPERANRPGADIPIGSRPFVIGSNKVVIYGLPLAIIPRSGLIAALAEDIEELLSQAVPLAVTNPVTETNARGLVFAWLTINGLLDPLAIEHDPRTVAQGYSLLDKLYMLQWLDYFQVHETEALVGWLRASVQYSIRQATSLTSEEAKLVGLIYDRYARACVGRVGPISSMACRLAWELGNKLGISPAADITLGALEPYNVITSLGYKLLTTGELDPTEKKWAVRVLEELNGQGPQPWLLDNGNLALMVIALGRWLNMPYPEQLVPVAQQELARRATTGYETIKPEILDKLNLAPRPAQLMVGSAASPGSPGAWPVGQVQPMLAPLLPSSQGYGVPGAQAINPVVPGLAYPGVAASPGLSLLGSPVAMGSPGPALTPPVALLSFSRSQPWTSPMIGSPMASPGLAASPVPGMGLTPWSAEIATRALPASFARVGSLPALPMLSTATGPRPRLAGSAPASLAIPPLAGDGRWLRPVEETKLTGTPATALINQANTLYNKNLFQGLSADDSKQVSKLVEQAEKMWSQLGQSEREQLALLLVPLTGWFHVAIPASIISAAPSWMTRDLIAMGSLDQDWSSKGLSYNLPKLGTPPRAGVAGTGASPVVRQLFGSPGSPGR